MQIRRRMLPWSLAVIVELWAHSPAAGGKIDVDERFPVKNEQIRVRVTDGAGKPIAGARVEVTYRPGSSVERIEPAGRSADDGALLWTPTEAGIAKITATWPGPDGSEVSSSRTVSVKFRSPPLDGILVMIVAGFLLIVGSVIRVFNLLREPRAF